MKTNRTNFTHALWGLGMQGLIAIPFGWWAGACFAAAWFISREHAQRECQISLYSGTPVSALKWWQGFTGWVTDRYGDSGFPMVACFLLAWWMT